MQETTMENHYANVKKLWDKWNDGNQGADTPELERLLHSLKQLTEDVEGTLRMRKEDEGRG